jgi:hypothetical protein
MADERVVVRVTSCPQNVKLSLKVNEPQVGQRHENVEKGIGILPHYYFLEILHGEGRGQVNTIVIEYFSSTSPDLLTSSILINQSFY